MDYYILTPSDLNRLIKTLQAKNYTTIGPRARDGAIVYEEISCTDDLPAGYHDEQKAKHYRVTKDCSPAFFNYVVGPQSLKKFLLPPVLKVWESKRSERGLTILKDQDPAPAYAFIGPRACELHAVAIQDKVLANSEHPDLSYKARRDKAFIVAVNCTTASDNCFCSSMKTGPAVHKNFDLALTEVVNKDKHFFAVQSGSEKGEELIKELKIKKSSKDEIKSAKDAQQNAVKQIKKKLERKGLRELLQHNLEHSQWSKVAERCLNCGNCVSVCPTCFCINIEDSTDLDGKSATRLRKWTSCFTKQFSYIHGGSVRVDAKDRYRQWITHKLSSWEDQFGTLGCVGCGRCITWCPAGIDITEESKALRESAS